MSRIIFKVSDINYNYILKKLLNYNISFKELTNKGNYYYICILEKDYELLKKIDYKKVVIFKRHTGLKHLIKFLNINIEKSIVAFIVFFNVFILSLFIYSVDIKINDEDLKTQIKYTLIDLDIKPYKRIKLYNYINKVKEKILNKYKDKIEWIEIEQIGSKYNVYVIKKVNNKKHVHNDRCNYVAKKSGVIKSLYASKGVLLVQENNYVKKGDILISGSVIYNDELKNEVCASGKITGEVWYKVNIEYPFSKTRPYNKYSNFHNIEIILFGKKYKIFKSNNKHEMIKNKIGNNTIGLNIYQGYKIKVKNEKYTEKEVLNKSLKKAKDSLLKKLPRNSRITDQKVLKKYVNNGKMYLEVLLTAEEEIGVVENY